MPWDLARYEFQIPSMMFERFVGHHHPWKLSRFSESENRDELRAEENQGFAAAIVAGSKPRGNLKQKLKDLWRSLSKHGPFLG
jgi:hypothetical protein